MKRLFASLLALVMLLSCIPVSSVHVHAEEVEETQEVLAEATETPAEVTEPATEVQEETVAPTEEVTEPVTEPVEETVEPTEEVTEPVTEAVEEETEPATEPVEVTDPVVEEITVETPAMEATAENVTADGLEYSVADGAVSITGYSGTATELTIPSTIEGLPVTTIASYAFKNCVDLTSVIVPDSVQTIGHSAFSLCFGLKSMTLPFVGGSRKTAKDTNQYPFGYIFGSNYAGASNYMPISQTYYGANSGRTTTSTYYIPDGLTSVTITGGEILYGAFEECKALTSVTMPAGITTIGAYAFEGCAGFTSFTIPASVTTIGSGTFTGCTGLTSFTVPNTVEVIGSGAFAGCTSLKSITLPFVGSERRTATDSYQYPFGYIFGTSNYSNTTSTYQSYYGSSTTSTTSSYYYIPDSLTSVTITGGEILRGAFQDCSKLTSITLPAGITTIGDYAFAGCDGLTAYTIPASVTTIGKYTFQDCGNLKTVTLPAGMTAINDYAFYECYGLERITLPVGIISIGDYAFYNCNGMESITIPEGVTTIGDYAFSRCTKLAYITLPVSLVTVESDAFYNMNLWHVFYAGTEDQWTKISIGNYNSALTNAARHYSTTDTSCIKPYTKQTCTKQGRYSCSLCGNILYDSSYSGSHTYENGVCTVCGASEQLKYSIKNDQITITGYSGSATEVTIPASIEGIPVVAIDEAFRGNKILTKVTIEKGVTTIGDSAFYNCTALKEVVIPDSVTSIGTHAFYNCTALESVTIPSSVTAIGENTFYNCTALESVTIPGSVATIGAGAFYNCKNLSRVVIGNGVTKLGNSAFASCIRLASLTIPASVTEIGNWAFEDDYALWHVFYGGTQAQWDAITIGSGNTRLTDADRHYGASESLTTLNKPTCTIDPLYQCGICSGICHDSAYTGEHSYADGICSVCGASSEYSYTFADNQITITKYTGTAENLVIPTHFEGYPVTGIGYEAFRNNDNIHRITFPKTLTSIGEYAFYDCDQLDMVAIPEGMTGVGDYAFNSCGQLNVVALPASLTESIYQSFRNCSIDHVFYSGTEEQWSNYAKPDYMVYDWVDVHTGAAADAIQVFDNTTCTRQAIFRCGICQDVIFDSDFTGSHNFVNGACSVCGVDQNLQYALGADGVTITGYTGTAAELTIPATIEGYPVVAIDQEDTRDRAFKNNTNLTKVVLPDSITYIGVEAFYGCTNLQSIVIPEGVTAIKSSTFYNCKNLQSVTIPQSVTEIGYAAFYYCEKLEKIELPGVVRIGGDAFEYCTGLKSVSFGKDIAYVGSYAFNQCANIAEVHIADLAGWLGTTFDGYSCSPLSYGSNPRKLYLNGELLTNVVIPEGVTQIAYGAFANCLNITEVTIPSSVTSIGSVAFKNCMGLSKLVIPEGVTFIGSEAFYGCKNMHSVTLPASLTELGNSAFSNCDNLANIYLSNIEAWLKVKFGENGNSTPMAANDLSKNLYLNGKLLLDLVIPEGITVIPKCAFYYCTDLQSVTIPNSVITIGNSAFYRCENISTLNMGKNVQSIGSSAFSRCKKLKTVDLPATLTTIGSYAFSGGQSLEKIEIPDSVNKMGEYVFQESSGLKKVVLGRGITAIPNGTFYWCRSLKDVTIPDTITAIDESAFYACTGMTKINLPGSIKSIGQSAFSECSALTELNLPNSVTTISASAFRYCYSLRHLTIPGSVSSIGANAFQYCSSLTDVTFGDGIESIGSHAFASCGSLVYVVIPDSVHTISNNVFSECNQLWHVLYKGSVSDWNSITISTENERLTGAIRHANAKGNEISTTAEATCITSIQCKCSFCAAEYANPDYEPHHNYINDVCDACGLLRNMEYELIDNTIIIRRYWGSVSELMIPSNIAGFPVVAIGDYAFEGCGNLTSVTIPDSVKTIGEYAFFCCTNLTQINIGSGVKTIGDYAFSNCLALTQVTIPDNVTKLGAYAFEWCPNLMSITLGDGLTTVGKNVFANSPSLWHILYQGSQSKWSKLSVSTKATVHYNATGDEIEPCEEYTCTTKAIFKCNTCNKRFLDKNFEGEHIFSEGKCTVCGASETFAYTVSDAGLTITSYEAEEPLAVIPEVLDGVTVIAIAENAFADRADVTCVAIPATVKTIGRDAFAGCTELACVIYQGTSSDKKFLDIDDGNTALTKATWHYDTCCVPAVTVSNDANGYPVLSWKSAPCVLKYEIYRSTSSKTGFELLTETTQTSFTDTDVSRGDRYYYKVTAINLTEEGSATCAAKVAYVCLAAPEVMIDNDAATGKPQLTWEPAEGAKKYEVYRATSANGTYAKLTTTTKLSYVDSKASFGKTYFYKVKSIGTSSSYNSSLTDALNATAICAQPAVKTSVNAASGAPTLTWKKITGAVAYRIYGHTEDGESYLLSEQTGLTFTDTDAPVDSVCTYEVDAVASNESCNSRPGNVVTAVSGIAAPQIGATTDLIGGKPIVFWDEVEGAVAYQITRATSKSGSYKTVDTISDLEFVDETAAVGKTYYYKVIAVGENSKSAASAYKNAKCVCAAPAFSTEIDEATGKPMLSWDKVSGAKKYTVYRSTEEDGTYVKLTTTTKLSYTDTKAIMGTPYYYKVTAVASKSSNNSLSSFIESATAICAQPALTLSNDAETGAPVLTWKAVAGAVEYQILRDDEVIAEQTELTYIDLDTVLDGLYNYRVVAVAENTEWNSISGEGQNFYASCAAPVISVSLDGNKPLVEWEAVDGAVEYHIYRSTKAASGYKQIDAVETESYHDTSAAKGKTYYYKVVAATEVSVSAFSDYAKIKSK